MPSPCSPFQAARGRRSDTRRRRRRSCSVRASSAAWYRSRAVRRPGGGGARVDAARAAVACRLPLGRRAGTWRSVTMSAGIARGSPGRPARWRSTSRPLLHTRRGAGRDAGRRHPLPRRTPRGGRALPADTRFDQLRLGLVPDPRQAPRLLKLRPRSQRDLWATASAPTARGATAEPARTRRHPRGRRALAEPDHRG